MNDQSIIQAAERLVEELKQKGYTIGKLIDVIKHHDKQLKVQDFSNDWEIYNMESAEELVALLGNEGCNMAYETEEDVQIPISFSVWNLSEGIEVQSILNGWHFGGVKVES